MLKLCDTYLTATELHLWTRFYVLRHILFSSLVLKWQVTCKTVLIERTKFWLSASFWRARGGCSAATILHERSRRQKKLSPAIVARSLNCSRCLIFHARVWWPQCTGRNTHFWICSPPNDCEWEYWLQLVPGMLHLFTDTVFKLNLLILYFIQLTSQNKKKTTENSLIM